MKAVTLVLLWLLGSATAIAVAWSGVSVLDNDLVAPAPAVVDAGGEVGLVSESIDPFDDDIDPLEESESLEDSETLTDRASLEGTASGPTSSDRSALAVAGDDPSPPASTTSTVTTDPTATTGTASTITSPGAVNPGQYVTKTFSLTGGATAIKFSPSSTKVLWATPNPGYEVRIEPESEGVKVEFRSDDHRSRIDAWWDGGPRHEIREED